MPVLAFLNQKGGVGKTTLATNVATALAIQKQRVLFIDADQQGSALDWSAARKGELLFPLVGLPTDTLHREIPALGEPYDWIFASPNALGTKPYWPDAVLKRHVLPAAARAGIAKKIGWHSFRRTLATLLQSSGASVKVTQDLMRHSSPLMTMGVYAKAVTADKRNAQDAIAALFVETGKESAA